jgi:mono/diheme cytochrome c family protein
MLEIRRRTWAVLTVLALTSFAAHAASDPFGPLTPNSEWIAADNVLTHGPGASTEALETRAHLGDTVMSFDYRAETGASATMYIMGRYRIDLPGNGNWTPVFIRFRAPRFDAGYSKSENALALDLRIGSDARRNVVFPKSSPGARWDAEDRGGPNILSVVSGPFSLRNVRYDAADYAQIKPPAASGGETNEKDLVDFVARGKELFTQVGCEACHLVEPGAAGVSTGPNLFGLFRREPRSREVAEGPAAHRFQVKANRDYLLRSLREPAAQLAVAESGPTQGQPYMPLMPTFTRDLLSDEQIDALGAYLATLNEVKDRGPAIRLAAFAPPEAYDPLADSLQFLVNDVVRMQRGPIAGVSARSIHVGFPGGVNYTFDPRVLAISKIWQGGFLDMTGELTNRGGRGLALGYDSREIAFGDRDYLLAPLAPGGKTIDFSFKEARFGDTEQLKKSLYAKEDQLAQIAAIDAQFLGYTRDSRSKTAAPAFRYRVGRNFLEVTTTIAADGTTTIGVAGTRPQAQEFRLNPALLVNASVSAGKLEGDRWVLPAGAPATLDAKLALSDKAWHPPASTYASFQRSPVVKQPSTAKLPAGYSVESWYPPKDNYGRDQLFEALGLSTAKDGTIVVASRTAGIWRIVNGEWRPFAEGLFDSLGVVAEDAKGLTVVAGQKAELTRITDTNGDGIADRYDTLFDAHSYHGNYHSYMHGPVRAKDGSYYFALNLVHDPSGVAWWGGGKVMGTFGGFNGWAIRLKPDGKAELFANGMRSPASLGVAPDGSLWYADNQGDFVATSKLFRLQQGKFYGHPAGLVDLPGMTPDSPEIQYDKVASKRETAIVLFPHNKVANSPGNPAWITQKNFGPFVGQMVIGDQTQSNLMRVVTEKVGDVEQGAVIPFFDNLESGVMRPMFLPDGSLLLGQTGRGWQAKGGKVASLQHVRWDGKTVAPGIVAMQATPRGFKLLFTQPLGSGVSAELLKSALSLESWTYRDAPDYGSPELDLHPDVIASMSVGADRKSVDIVLASTEVPKVNPRQTPRVYHASLASQTLFDSNAPAQLDAYYSLQRFPVPTK